MKQAWKQPLRLDPRSDLMKKKCVKTVDLGPRPHGIFSDRDKHGNARISVTLPRKGRRGGKRLRTLTGHQRNIAYPYLSTILYDHIGMRFTFDADGLSNEYHTISEDAAIQMLLLMDAVRSEPISKKAVSLAEAIAGMNSCEAAWWYAHHCNRRRPRRVMQALALMHS